MDLINKINGRNKPYPWIREPKKIGWMDFSDAAIQKIMRRFSKLGYPVELLKISVQEYNDYFDSADYAHRYPQYYPFALKEKSLEHFLAARLLELSPQDIYIDIASEGSPVPEIYTRLFGVKSFRQDLAYPKGLNGDTIGGDAAEMPVPDHFASKMALHCSLEHFEGDSDIRFFHEAIRVLKPHGRICVVPFYVFEKFSVVTDPEVARAQNVSFDMGAVVYCVKGWANRHGRYYDPQQFLERIASAVSGCKIQIFHIPNFRDVDPSCYLRFALLIEKTL